MRHYKVQLGTKEKKVGKMSMNLSKDSTNELLYVAFNQDNGCFACGITDGFVIFNVDPYRETFRRVFNNGGIGIVEMLFRCNLIAIVGGGRNPKYPTNKVMIWDDHQSKCIGELMFKSEVHAVKLRRDRVVVVLNTKVYVYRFSDLKLIDQISTLPNPKGLVSLCADTSNNVLAVPGLVRGSIRIELYDISKATIIKAHDADLAQFSLNSDGSRIASASEKGTLIRLWDCHTGDPLKEFRRGTDRAEIYCIAFNTATTFLACSSDKGTIHIFSLNDQTQLNRSSEETIISSRDDKNNKISSDEYRISENITAGMQEASPSANNKGFGLKFLREIIPNNFIPKYINSVWSYAQIRGLDSKSICAFDRDNMRIIVLTADGTFLVCAFEEGGECQRLSTATFLRSHNDIDINANSITSNQNTFGNMKMAENVK
jgi:WD40 repeat protein